MNKSFKHGFLLAFALALVVIPLTLSMELWAPSILKHIGSIGDYQYKPWIYFLPLLIAIFITFAIFPNYRNRRAFLGLISGGIAITAGGGAVLLALAIMSMPTMRF